MEIGSLSVRARVTAIAIIVVAIVLVITGLALVSIQRTELGEALDRDVLRQLDRVEMELASSSPEDVADRFASPGDEDRALQLTTRSGGLVATSRNLSAGEPMIDGTLLNSPLTIDLPTVDDDSFRAAARQVGSGESDLVALVALSTDDVLESSQTLTTALVIVLPVVLILLGLVIWRLVGRTLQPVEAIRAEVASIGSRDLHRRVPEPRSRDEIGRLATTMNGMLDRLERSNRRQRRFVGDASHELRGPMTRIRTALEVDRARPDRFDLARTHDEVLEEVIGMEQLVDDLLHLAQSDDGAQPTRRISVDLDDIVLEECRRLRVGRVEVDSRRVSAAGIVGDPTQLRRAVRNLLDNAVRHAGSRVAVRLAEADFVELVVEDDGPGIAVEDRDVIFDRFTRLDEARSAAEGGTGLGLAITKEIVERHGGVITVEDGETGGAAFRIRLPPEDDVGGNR